MDEDRGPYGGGEVPDPELEGGEDLDRELDDFLDEVLNNGDIPSLPPFLGEEWEELAEAVADLLRRFKDTLVIEATRPDGTECYVQFAREDMDLRAELVSNEFLGTKQLPPVKVSQLVDEGWDPPSSESEPNFSHVFIEPNLDQLAWQVLQTLHDIYDVEPTHTWAVMPADLLAVEPTYADTKDQDGVEHWEMGLAEPPEANPEETHPRTVESPAEPIAASLPFELTSEEILASFQMPNAVTIAGRSSSITNSFVNSIIPVIVPTAEEVREALQVLGMSNEVVCSYCGDPWTEWDHLRPIVVDKTPTGYIHEIHNLVPACGKCNQSKGNRPWRTWMYGQAKKSPKTRRIADLDERAARLQAYEEWKPPTKLDLAEIVGAEEWRAYWKRWHDLIGQMRDATKHASRIRALIASALQPQAGPPLEIPSTDDASSYPRASKTGWSVSGPKETIGPVPKNRAVLEAVRALMGLGAPPESMLPLLGQANFRSVPGNLEGEALWQAFAMSHGKSDEQRRLWFWDLPIHTDTATWVLAKNVWGKQTYSVFKELVTLCGGAVTVTQPTGFKVRRHEQPHPISVLKPGVPIPPKKPLSRSKGDQFTLDGLEDGPLAGWSGEERLVIQRLAAVDPRWSVTHPHYGFGSQTLRIAASLAEQGLHVRPTDDADQEDEALADVMPASLIATIGERCVAVFTDDYDQRDPQIWARMRERLGPFPDSPAVDKVLAEFSVHGPFERSVIRRNGQVWVIVMVRLDDVKVALQDLGNVTLGLESALEAVAGSE